MESFMIHLLLLVVVVFGTVYSEKTTNFRLDCHFDYDELTKEKCTQRGCIWDNNSLNLPNASPSDIPQCYLNTSRIGYKLVDPNLANHKMETTSTLRFNLSLLPSSSTVAPKLKLIETLQVTFTALTSNVFRFQIHDANNLKRYEVPVQKTFPLLSQSHAENVSLKYWVEIGNNPQQFGFKVVSKLNNQPIWDSSFGGGLLYSDQFLQIATRLNSHYLYGMGENTHTQYLHNLNYKTWPLFAFDQPPDDLERNSYGVHPFMMILQPKSGITNGIFFLNSNAMEYTLMPEPGVSFKTSGGILDFFLFTGEKPEDVVQQYLSLIGRPMMPPFWGLGFQLSRYGYKNTKQVLNVIERNLKYNIPLDVSYVDIDYMNIFQDFTYDHTNFADLPVLVNQTKETHDLRWVFIIDAAIQGNDTNYKLFKEGYDQNVYVTWDSSIPLKNRGNPNNVPLEKSVFYGRVWPRGPSSFPDFFKNSTGVWWEKYLRNFKQLLNYDGIWIDMNEPANFDNTYEVCPTKNCYMSRCPQNQYDFPDVRLKAVWVHNKPDRRLSYRTLCLATRQGEKSEFLHYDVHSLYAHTEAIQTNRAVSNILGKRPLILSRSSYVSSGRYTAHWTGDNTSKWSHLRRSIIGMLQFNIFGIPWVGADICGFQFNTTPELCLRWSQVGALYPFSRNHNDIPNTVDQDPGAWMESGHPEVTKAANASLQFRYAHLHYYYTLFYKAHTKGSTVIRPVFHEYPHDTRTYDLNEQFMVGSSILVAPFLHENQTELEIYLPADSNWFSAIDGEYYHNLQQTTSIIYDSRTLPPTFFRSGSIIPTAVGTISFKNTKSMRQLPLGLSIYPHFSYVDTSGNSTGDLYWDDGESLDSIEKQKYNYYQFYFYNQHYLNISAQHVGYTAESLIVDQIQIFEPFREPDTNYTLHLSSGVTIKGVHTNNYLTFSGIKLNLAQMTNGQTINMWYTMW